MYADHFHLHRHIRFQVSFYPHYGRRLQCWHNVTFTLKKCFRPEWRRSNKGRISLLPVSGTLWPWARMDGRRVTSLMQCWCVQANTSIHRCPCRTSQVPTQRGDVAGFNLATKSPQDINIMFSSPGHDTFSGTCIHSRDYKDGSTFRGKRVMVVGIGNSGGDIASEISRHAAKVGRMGEIWYFRDRRLTACTFIVFFTMSAWQTFLSTRKGAWVVGRMFSRGIPVDLIILSRFKRLLLGLLPRPVANWAAERSLNSHCDHRFYGLQPAHRWATSSSVSTFWSRRIITQIHLEAIPESLWEKFLAKCRKKYD